MKKLLTLTLLLCIATMAGNAYGQETKKQKEEKAKNEAAMKEKQKDATVIDDTAKPPVKDEDKVIEGQKHPRMEGDTARRHEGKKPPVKEGEEAKDSQKPVKEGETAKDGNAYGKNKEGLEGKEFGQTRSGDAKSKQATKSDKKTKKKGKKR